MGNMLTQSELLSRLKAMSPVRYEKLHEMYGDEGLNVMRDLVSLELAEGLYCGNSYVFRYVRLKGEL